MFAARAHQFCSGAYDGEPYVGTPAWSNSGSNARGAASGASVSPTWSHSSFPSGSDVMGIVWYGVDCTSDADHITFSAPTINSVSCTHIGTFTTSEYMKVAAYYVVAPGSGKLTCQAFANFSTSHTAHGYMFHSTAISGANAILDWGGFDGTSSDTAKVTSSATVHGSNELVVGAMFSRGSNPAAAFDYGTRRYSNGQNVMRIQQGDAGGSGSAVDLGWSSAQWNDDWAGIWVRVAKAA